MAHGALVAGCHGIRSCDVASAHMGGGKSLGGGWDVAEMIELHRIHCPYCAAEMVDTHQRSVGARGGAKHGYQLPDVSRVEAIAGLSSMGGEETWLR